MTSYSRQGGGSLVDPTLRVAALSVAAAGLIYTINNYFNFWRGWPGLDRLFAYVGWFGLDPLPVALDGGAVALGWIQLAFYLGPIAGIVALVLTTRERPLRADAETLSALHGGALRGRCVAAAHQGAHVRGGQAHAQRNLADLFQRSAEILLDVDAQGLQRRDVPPEWPRRSRSGWPCRRRSSDGFRSSESA